MDRLTKAVHLLPTVSSTKAIHLLPTFSSINAKGAACFYIRNVFPLDGQSDSIVCDRDMRFTTSCFQKVPDELGTKLALSTTNRTQTDQSTTFKERVDLLWTSSEPLSNVDKIMGIRCCCCFASAGYANIL